MAATILRYANSAAFRGVTATSTLEAAITRIGAKEVSKIALATTIGASAIVSGCLSQLRRRSWRLAMTSALLCRALSRWRRQDPEEAFICGLLHDFGRVVATACFEEVITRTRDLRVMTEAAWAEAVDRFHVELGLVTAARWNLPPLICGVIMAHHVPESDPINKTMIEIVNAGDAVAALLDQAPNLTAPDLAAIGLRPDETESLLAEVGTIATAVASLDETTPGKDTGIFRISSRVLAPTSALAEPIKEGRFPCAFCVRPEMPTTKPRTFPEMGLASPARACYAKTAWSGCASKPPRDRWKRWASWPCAPAKETHAEWRPSSSPPSPRCSRSGSTFMPRYRDLAHPGPR